MDANCRQLLNQVDEASFAMDDVTLYLDTHPTDRDALNYYKYVVELRKQAMAAYEQQCGPLMIDSVRSCKDWTWLNDKWPWEGGCN